MKIIEDAIEAFKMFPGVGKKTATRYVFYLLKEDDKKLEDFIEKIRNLKQNLKTCPICFSLSLTSPCEICTSNQRDPSLLCVVEDMQKLYFLEKSGIFSGKYHILGGLLSPLKGMGEENLNLKPLIERIEREPIKEVILALSPNVEGLTTTRFLENLLKDYNITVSELAKGLSIGTELDWVDDTTLKLAMEGRVKFKK
ncbi:MAG: recombination mediator RecR [Thermoanaerobaculia bacterium]